MCRYTPQFCFDTQINVPLKKSKKWIVIAIAAATFVVAVIAVLTAKPSLPMTVYYSGLTTNKHNGLELLAANFLITNHSQSIISIDPALEDPKSVMGFSYNGPYRPIPPGAQLRLIMAVGDFDIKSPEYRLHLPLPEELTGFRSIPTRIRMYFKFRKLKAENKLSPFMEPHYVLMGGPLFPAELNWGDLLFHVNLTNKPSELIGDRVESR